MSDSESDVAMHSALQPKKKTPKPPTSPTAGLLREPKKMTTKFMILKTLADLNTRKGVSMYAIKKHMTENFDVNTEKLNYYIKKYIKTEVEKGTIIQTKGIGASGSFRLAPIKKKTEKIMLKKPKPKEKKPTEKPEKEPTEKPKKMAKKTKKGEPINAPPPSKKSKSEKSAKTEAPKKKLAAKPKAEEKAKKEPKQKKPKAFSMAKPPESPAKKKTKTSKMAKQSKTPAEKRAVMLKRKSIGSIIKPPKMKPRSIKAK